MSDQSAPPVPSPVAPVQGEAVTASPVTFQWEGAEHAEAYYLQVARDPGFNQLLFDAETGSATSYEPEELPEQAGMTLHWRVCARAGETWSAYSDAASFETANWIADPAPVAVEGGAAGVGMHDGRQSRSGWTAMMIIVGVTMALVVATLIFFTDIDLSTDPSTEPADAAAQASASGDTTNIDAYGVVNAEQGVYRVPIDEVMDEMAQGTPREP